MLRLRILSIGRDRDRWAAEGCDHYLKLLSRFARVKSEVLPAVKSSAALSATEHKAREADRLKKAVGRDLMVALHEAGRKYDSKSFAGLLERLQTESGGRLAMVIGGAFGLDKRLLKQAHLVVSLSHLTFSHQLTRLVLLEQLYRGFSILHHTAYHK